jgi:[acyl-carrier-protein] S-malonyltransferase
MRLSTASDKDAAEPVAHGHRFFVPAVRSDGPASAASVRHPAQHDRHAWVFAGHGSQYSGMGRGFPFDDAAVRPVFEAAERISGLQLRELSRDAESHHLRAPSVLEPLLAAFSLAYAALLRARGRRPHAVAGYSAGLLPALVCAGVLDVESALTLAVRRGALLETAAAQGSGAMLAAYGLPVARIVGALQRLPDAQRIDVAGWNSPTHLTLAGGSGAMQAAGAALRAAGARTLDVPAAGAWHSRQAAGLARQFAQLSADVEFRAPRLPVYSSVSALREDDPRRLRRHLAEQIEAPVYWQATVANLCAGEGVRNLVEVGCGRTLAGLQGTAPRHPAPAPVFSNLFQQLKVNHA